jgi:hypothetical protein
MMQERVTRVRPKTASPHEVEEVVEDQSILVEYRQRSGQ